MALSPWQKFQLQKQRENPTPAQTAQREAEERNRIAVDIEARSTVGFVPDEGPGINIRGRRVDDAKKGGKSMVTVGLQFKPDGVGVNIS